MKLSFASIVALTGLVLAMPTFSVAQNHSHDRILHRPQEGSVLTVRGTVHPLARAKYDHGKIDASFRMERMTMLFKPTDEQQSELDRLVGDQQNPASPNYHKWLTPEEFADRFGLSPHDVSEILSWLRSQGFTVNEVAATRRWVVFTGKVWQVESAFQTTIHQYDVDGQTFYANATDPVIPAAFADVVLGFRSFNNFRMTPRPHLRRVDKTVFPQFTSSVTGNHFLAPADFATIYNLNHLYAAGLDGTGQRIAIVGQTDIQLSDIQAFRVAAGLPPNDPQVVLVPGSSDPGIISGDLEEASLDIEWSGAVARNAQIIFVTSNNGVFDALQYAINQNLAPVISMSYGSCERNFTSQEASAVAALAQQANAQGMTIVAASGDSGAADCESTSAKIASRGLAVDIPASIPFVTAVGGTAFQETSAASWSSTIGASNGSAVSYIPEIVWNDTAIAGRLTASGGGRSIYFSKPVWQTGVGVPDDKARDVPDISLNASGSHDGYLICSGGNCVNGFRSSNGGLTVVGGTSAGAPAFAGVVAILNQLSNSAQGNVNPKLYAFAASAPSAFHDITSGGNQVPCQIGTLNCPSGSMGYAAGEGYDQATGLGSLDVANLLAEWVPISATLPSTSTPDPTATPTPISQPAAGVLQPISTLMPTPTAPEPISAVEDGTARSGYAVITPASSSAAPAATVTFGIVKSGFVQSQAGILPTPMMTDASLFVDVVPGIGRDLGVAIVNPSSTANAVTVTLRDQTGTVAGQAATIVLQPQQQVAKFVTELLPPAIVGSAFRGSIELQSTTPFAVLGLRFSGSEFSTLPVTGIAAAPGVPVITLTNDTVGGSTATVLPQFVMSGGWATQIALVNNGNSAAQGRIDIFDPTGAPMPINLNGVTQSTFLYTISPGGVFLLAPRDANGQSPF